jgi:hypothetical protein
MHLRSIAMFALVVIAAQAAGSKAEAQVFGGPRVFVGPGGPVTLTPGYGYGNGNGSVGNGFGAGYGSAPATPLPYSYYGVPSWQPARIYEGPAVFPFYGRPYGHPYDRWTWPYISGGSDANLARYYYPPLG